MAIIEESRHEPNSNSRHLCFFYLFCANALEKGLYHPSLVFLAMRKIVGQTELLNLGRTIDRGEEKKLLYSKCC